MADFFTAIAAETAWVFYEGSLYILIGFFIAGLLHVFLPTETIGRHLGRDDLGSVTLAALFGAPIPLCSCGVLPAATALRKKGASRSSLLSFTISTPETGVDSIALTYALLGPVMAVVRPIVAVVTAIAAGIASIFAAQQDGGRMPDAPEEEPHSHDDACAADHDLGEREEKEDEPKWRANGREAMRYGFRTLLDEIAFWIVLGIALTGLLSAMLPDDFFTSVLGWEGGLLPMLAMIVAGVPLYLCASASTPVAAALIAKGLSPGAALCFLLVGPATNAATLAVVGRLLGRRALRIYLGAIVLVTLAAGLLLDAFAGASVSSARAGALETPDAPWFAAVKVTAAFAFVVLLATSFQRTRFREGLSDLRGQLGALGRAAWSFDVRWLTRPATLLVGAALLLLWLVPRSALVVDAGHAGVIQRFGRVVASDLEPGLHWHLPPPLGKGTSVDVDLLREVSVGFRGTGSDGIESLGEDSMFLTADENVIDLRSIVHYRVDDATAFALRTENPDELVRSLARRELVSLVARRTIDTIYTRARRQTESACLESLQRRAGGLGLGIEVVGFHLVHVHAPGEVHDAFRDVASALEDKQRGEHEASGYAAKRKAEAQGEATAIREQAAAAAARLRSEAEGEADAFLALAGVAAEHPETTRKRLWLESLERSLPGSRKYVHVPVDARGDVDVWLGTGPPPPVATAGDDDL